MIYTTEEMEILSIVNPKEIQRNASRIFYRVFYIQLKFYITLSLVAGLFFLEPVKEHVWSIARQKLVLAKRVDL